MKRHNYVRSGFSLLELLAVTVILGTLALLIVPRITNSSGNAKQKADEMNRAHINSLVEQYYLNEGVWPADNLNDIGADVNYFPEGVPSNPVTGAAYVLNSTTHRVQVGGGGK